LPPLFARHCTDISLSIILRSAVVMSFARGDHRYQATPPLSCPELTTDCRYIVLPSP
jgi:hypothetical protein